MRITPIWVLSFALVFALAVAACNSPKPSGNAKKQPANVDDAAAKSVVQHKKQNKVPIHKPGGCRNIDYKGMCSFMIVRKRGTPLPDGRVEFVVTHMADGIKRMVNSVLVIAKPSDLPALADFYRKNSPVKCGAVIVSPPCAPSASAKVELGPPPVGVVSPRGP